MELGDSDHQLRLVVEIPSIIRGFSTIPGGFLARFLNHHISTLQEEDGAGGSAGNSLSAPPVAALEAATPWGHPQGFNGTCVSQI